MADELVERNTLIAILCRLTTKPGRDHRSGQEFVVAGSSQEIVDALRQAAVILRRDNSSIEALERENATLRAERDEARKALEKSAALIDRLMHVHVAPDECSSYVERSRRWLLENGGSLAAIADNRQQIAAAIRNMGGEADA